MLAFIPGWELSELFYKEAVKLIIESYFREISDSPTLIGCGAEVLGFDTPHSTDHHWEPKVLLFLHEKPTNLTNLALPTS